ncbi:putative TIM-barrel fold metal-dependent hydrolase [Actinocorallia herbida]|uniref:Putative TIM-barrel fold metal-dependent hydrolase n=1 Tax=Actinocorallia herbida TaxID=58109 RepID=A0A3N1CX77_9ACTN|nr:amidohydrolase family protein [Actinocorallia herbida]ROO85902.1 putative TIM-barrel fold metal-dependent hydrolase [Actinocorallia herbida]
MADQDAAATALRETALCERYAVADVDSHIIEPADLWTSRISTAKWGDLVPHVRFHERRQEDVWYIGDRKLYGVGAFAQAGWAEFPPSHPKRLSEALPAAIDAKERLAYNDRVGVHYQVLYPNIVGFHSHRFLNQMPRELATLCVQAYNDWVAEFASADPSRLIPMMMLPFWDIDESVAEMRRAHEMGHKGVLFAARYDKVGLPRLMDDYWEPVLGQAQEMGLSMNFHVGFLASDEDLKGAVDQSKKIDFTRESSLVLLGNAQNIAEVVLSGVCHRYPDLKFVSVENGAGWLPFFSETMDWQWLNVGAHKEYPDRLLPSEYMKRQIYGMFWFERQSVRSVIDQLGDNLMFETDFPHATSLSPGPASESPSPRDVMELALTGLPEETIGKVLQHTATELYNLDPPVR